MATRFRIADNGTPGTIFCAGVAAFGGSSHLIDCMIEGTVGGNFSTALFVARASVTVERCSVRDNVMTTNGGAIRVVSTQLAQATVVLIESCFANNSAQGTSQFGGIGAEYITADILIDHLTSIGTDTNDDGDVGVADLLAVINHWNTSGRFRADVNCTASVDVEDLLDIIASWTATGQL